MELYGEELPGCSGSVPDLLHIGMLCITVCGNAFSALAMCGVSIVYFRILTGNVFVTFASGWFQTYYRIPLLEKMKTLLSPFSLAEALTGRDVYEKPLVLRFTPSADLIAAALAWIFLLLLFTALASRKRKAERTGRIFAVLTAERIAEAGISFLAGVWAAGFALDLSGMMRVEGLRRGVWQYWSVPLWRLQSTAFWKSF